MIASNLTRNETLRKGPRGERRPADPIECAVHVAKLATREITEDLDEEPSRQRRGGLARADKLSAEERSAIAQKAAAARWKPKG